MDLPECRERLAALLRSDPPDVDTVDFVALQRVDRVAVVTLARPQQHNVLCLDSWRRIAVVARTLADDPTVHAVVLRGAGGRAFGTGADIKEFPSTRMSAEHAVDYNEAVARGLTSIAAIPVPVLAMIEGLAVGGGLELSAACDVRFASDDSRLGLPIGRLGVTLGYTEAAALVRLVGASQLKLMVMSGDLVSADEALRMGLVQRVVPRDALVDAVVSVISNVLVSSMPTLKSGKLVADMAGRAITAADTEALARYTVEVYGGPDLAEGVAAFAERRAPVFPSQNVAAPTTGTAAPATVKE